MSLQVISHSLTCSNCPKIHFWKLGSISNMPAALLDPNLWHDDTLAAQEWAHQHRSGGAPKRKCIPGDITGDVPSSSSLTKPKSKKKVCQYHGDSEAPNTPATWSTIGRTDRKTHAASSPLVVYHHSEVNDFICESINSLHQFYNVEPTMELFQINFLVPLHAIS